MSAQCGKICRTKDICWAQAFVIIPSRELVVVRMGQTYEEVPGVYFFLGVGTPDPDNPGVNHSPYFKVDEASLPIGVRAMSSMAMDYLSN